MKTLLAGVETLTIASMNMSSPLRGIGLRILALALIFVFAVAS